MLKLIDYIKINPNKKLSSLGKEDKIKLIDSAINPLNKQGLVITYDLSHSGRRINNRIYSPTGQQDGIISLTNPYNKPILRNHDPEADPIGRFIGGEWQDLSNEALNYFSRVESFVDLKNSFIEKDSEKIYTLLKRNNLLTDKNWPGLGRMRVQANITDKDAIEKFLDGRYLTFSAGSTTDSHVCSICQSDWAKSDICEHRHGRIYDGEICVFITNDFKVLEGSVVNMPADDLSKIHSMELYTSDNILKEKFMDAQVDPSTFYFSDYSYNFSKELEVSMEINEKSSEDKQIDSTVKKALNESIPSPEEKIVEKVMEELVKDSSEVTESKGEDNEEKTKPSEQIDSSTNNEENQSEEEQEISNGTEVRGLQADLQKEVEVDIKDVELDWYLLDNALSYKLGLSLEEREKLEDFVFCGPDRSFPIVNMDHIDIAKELVNKTSLLDTQKKEIFSIIDARSEKIKIDSKANKAFSNLKEEMKKEIDSLKKLLAEKLKVFSIEEKQTLNDINNKEQLGEIENPSVSNSDDGTSPQEESLLKGLGSYEKNIVKEYIEILNKDGEAFANMFLDTKSRYLKKGFDPKKYIK